MSKTRRIIISYRSVDRDVALEIYQTLKSSGFNVWIDQEMQPGQIWRDELLGRLRDAEVCIPVISNAYLDSEHCRLELFVSRSFGQKILPVMLEECWSRLDEFEETRDVSRIQGIKLYNMKSVGLPISKDRAYELLLEPLVGKTSKKNGVYISYFSENAVHATAIADELTDRGLTSWIATRDSTVGEDWRMEQAKAMFDSACHLVIARPGITGNQFLSTELMLSEAMGIPVYSAIEPTFSDEPSINKLNAELRAGGMVYDRLFQRHHIKTNDLHPIIPDSVVTALKSEIKPRKSIFGFTK